MGGYHLRVEIFLAIITKWLIDAQSLSEVKKVPSFLLIMSSHWLVVSLTQLQKQHTRLLHVHRNHACPSHAPSTKWVARMSEWWKQEVRGRLGLMPLHSLQEECLVLNRIQLVLGSGPWQWCASVSRAPYRRKMKVILEARHSHCRGWFNLRVNSLSSALMLGRLQADG